MVYITAFYTVDAAPKTGLQPTITLYDLSDNSSTTTTLSEVGGGWYKYNLTFSDYTKEYAFTIDGGTSLSESDRYKVGTTDNYVDLIRALGLTQENFYIDTCNYDAGGNLIACRIRTYSDAASVGTASNVIATYNVTAGYSGQEMTAYKSVRA